MTFVCVSRSEHGVGCVSGGKLAHDAIFNPPLMQHRFNFEITLLIFTMQPKSVANLMLSVWEIKVLL